MTAYALDLGHEAAIWQGRSPTDSHTHTSACAYAHTQIEEATKIQRPKTADNFFFLFVDFVSCDGLL